MLLEPLHADPAAPVARANPLAKLAAAALVMGVLFLSLDPLTPAILLVAVLAAAALSGLRWRALLRRSLPLLAAAAGVAVFNGLLGAGGPSLANAVATALRLVAIGLAGVVAFVSIDPTDLADALVQHLRAPHRFAIGALAAFRLLPLFASEWETIGLARRARGIDDAAGFRARLAAFQERSFALLVGAIRRGVRLAIAMDARGFGSAACRTIARPRPLTARDGVLVLAALVVCAAAVAIGLLLGTWRPLLGR